MCACPLADLLALAVCGSFVKGTDEHWCFCQLVQVLGDGDLAFKLTIKAAKFSTSAKEKIQAAGGEAVEIPQKAKWTRALHKRKVAAAAAAAPKKAPAPKPITKKAVKQ